MAATTSKASIILAVNGALDLSAQAVAFDTAEGLRDKLGDLARLTYVVAEWRYSIEADAASVGVVLLELMAGDTVLDSVSVDFADGQKASEAREVDVFGVGGGQRLHIRATVEGEEAARSAQLTSILSVSQPLSVTGC